MSKFEMEFELSGLKLKIKSDKADIPTAIKAVQQQLGGMLQTAAGLASDSTDQSVVTGVQSPGPKTIDVPAQQLSAGRGRRGGRGKRSESKAAVEPIVFNHDAEKYGLPSQDWNTAKKALWLLYILEIQTEHKEVSSLCIAATFKKYIKEFGPILPFNVTRDLAKAKVNDSHVSTDTSKDPEMWFLLDGGKKFAAKLIEERNAQKAK